MKLSDTFKEARRLHRLGFAIIWLHPKSKRPIESGWTTGKRVTWEYLTETYIDTLNVGVRLGQPSKLNENKFLAVVDVDIKSPDKRHRAEALAAARASLKDVECPWVRSGRGGGSRHYYCVTDKPFKTFNPAESEEFVKVHMPSKKPSKIEIRDLTEEELASGIRLSRAWEISLYSDGRQVVLPPSIHPDSGKMYTWAKHIETIDDLPLIEFDLPKEEDENATTRRDTGILGTSEPSPSKTTKKTLKDFEVVPVDISWLPISDTVRDAITDGVGVSDRSGYLMTASNALLSAGLSQNEILSVLTDPTTYIGACGYDHAQTKNRSRAAAWVYKYTLAKVVSERSVEGIFSKASEMPEPKVLTDEEIEAQNEEFKEVWHWRQDLQKTDKNQIRITLKNLHLILTNAIDGEVFKKDCFANKVVYGVDAPWGCKVGEPLKDIDLILIKDWFAHNFKIEPATNAILEAVSLVAHQFEVHPVREWLQSLSWDGTKRAGTWLKDYCEGVAEEPYLSEVSRKFLVAMVKRVFEPGCQWDYVLTLQGKQGKYKSSIARALASDKWFMDNLPDLKDKDSMLNLQGKWLIELGELTNIKRSDHNLVKAYLVRRTDSVRPHYGRITEDVPRQSVFIGTVNEGQYLKDPTGNRRFWPVNVGTCDVEGLKSVRDQLFAEAYHLYKEEREKLMLSAEATEQATVAQEERRIDDDETDMREALEDFKATPAGEDFDWSKFRTKDLFYGTSAPWGRWSDKSYASQTAAQVLRNLGYERRKVKGQRIWGSSEEPKIIKRVGHTGGQGAHPVKYEITEMDFF